MIPNKIVTIFISLILIVGTIYLGILSWNALKQHNYIGVSEEPRHSITISGEGKVTGVPDVARIDLGHSVEKKTVAQAQKDNTEKMNAIINKLKKDYKIEDKDVRTTSYYITPSYDWINGKQVLRGYQVSQNLSVKIRSLDQVSKILDEAGSAGLNQIGGLTFEIDDPEILKQEARIKALNKAKEKAEALAQVTGVKLGRIVSFSESSNEPFTPAYKSYELGIGGGAAPSVEPGSTEISVIATVVYEIL